MPFTESHIPTANLDRNQDNATGLLIQNPASTYSTQGGLTATPPATGQKFYGPPIVVGARVGIAANSPAASTTYRATIFNKNCPHKMKVQDVQLRIVDLTAADFGDADGGNLDFTLIRGDGAASETESDVLADQTLDDDFENGETVRYPHATVFLANDEIVEGGSLYADLIVDPDDTAGATNDGAVVDVFVTLVPII